MTGQKLTEEPLGIEGLEDWEVGYMAGYLDADGSVQYVKGCPRVCIVNTFKPILEWYQSRFGGGISVQNKATETHRPAWIWAATGDTAMRVMEAMEPYMWEKAPQIWAIQRMRKMTPSRTRDFGVSVLKKLKRLHYDT